jgi:glutathione-regulated potassium-efflux system protein KefB
MAVTPLLVMLVAHLFKSAPSAPSEVPSELKTVDSHTPRVVLAGMGRMGQVIARVLRAQHVPFVALDNSVDAVEMSRSLGQMPIFYGNPLRPEILRAAQVDKAEWFIVATDDPETNLKTTELVRKLYPHVKVIARARNRQHVHKLWDLNALAVRETFHSSLEMSHQVLRGLGLSEEQAAARLRRFKRHDEEVLEAQHRVYDNQAEVQQTARQARDELENLFNSDQIDERRDA